MEFGPKHLFTLADHLGAHEIVVPDALGDVEETLARAMAFSRYAKPDYRYMAALQGTNMDEILKCLRAYLEMPVLMYITCIGIPRLLTYWDKDTRVTMANFIKAEGLDVAMEYHALGASNWIHEVVMLASTGIIRGIDTSMPVYMGLQGLSISKDSYITRPDDYFDLSKDNKQADLNAEMYIQWSGHDHDYVPEKAS